MFSFHLSSLLKHFEEGWWCMVIIFNVTVTLVTYLDHIPNYKVLCKDIIKVSSLEHLTSALSQFRVVTHYTRL